MSSFASGYIKYIQHLEQINDAAVGGSEKMIEEVEKSYHSHIKTIADDIVKFHKKAKICMLAGPSSSGKTTTAHFLEKYLSENGKVAHIISLDDFFLPHSKMIPKADGSLDFDTVDAVDIDAIKNCLSLITQNKTISVPNYSFEVGKPVGDDKKFEISENDFVIIEGIHALNPIFTTAINDDEVVKLYVSVKQPIKDENGDVVTPNDIRLTRRIIRDLKFRFCSAERTLSMWNMVEAGEDKYIRPYRFEADYTVNSVHIYEPCVLRNFVIPKLREIERYSPYFKKARELEGKLMRFEGIPKDKVPQNSLLREFIGE